MEASESLIFDMAPTKAQARRFRKERMLLKLQIEAKENTDVVIVEKNRTTCWDNENIPKNLRKYFLQRHSLFTKFDQGIQIDVEGWYSVTPEKIAAYIANRMKLDVVIDAFCGVGGNAIQFAKTSKLVIAIDIDQVRLDCARNNARVYGVEDKIIFIHGDFMKQDLVKAVSENCGVNPSVGIFLSPPWGGVDYRDQEFRIQNMVIDGFDILKKCQEVTKNICYFLPRNTRVEDLLELGDVEIERCFLDDREKSCNFYFHELISTSDEYDHSSTINQINL